MLASFAMDYNPVGSITRIVDTAPPRSRVFGYDLLQRLRSETLEDMPASAQ